MSPSVDEHARQQWEAPPWAALGGRHAQAGHLAEYLAAEAPLDALYTGPLNRARQTAAPVAERFGLDVVVDDGVAEWDRHSNEYVPIEELKAADDPRWQALLRGEWTSHDETPEQFAARVVDAIEAIVARHRSERAAVVCHGGVINPYLAHVLGLGAQHSFFYPNYTSIHRVAAATSGSVRSSRSTRPPTSAAPACLSACSGAELGGQRRPDRRCLLSILIGSGFAQVDVASPRCSPDEYRWA